MERSEIKMLRNRVFLYMILLLLMILALSSIISSCSNNNENTQSTLATESKAPETKSTQTTETQITSSTTNTKESITGGTGYLDLYQGLHITGIPIDVDIKTYRLTIDGLVNKEVSLTFDDVKKLSSVREEISLTCPGFFTDVGFWTGARVIDLLNLAGVQSGAIDVNFYSIDKSYSKTLPLDLLKNDGFLIAYQFNDKEFSKYHGYPLRLVAKGEAGSNWVKWLGEIKVVAN